VAKSVQVTIEIGDVNRVRGKNILWLPMIAVLLSVTITAAIGAPAPTPTLPQVYLTPTGDVPASGLMHPDDVYSFTINIKDVTDLFAAQVTVKYPAFYEVVTPRNFAEGNFLSDTGATIFYTISDPVTGTITFIILKTGPQSQGGASGSGLLASWEFRCVEAGEGAFSVGECILLNSYGTLMPYTTGPGGFFHGSVARLIRVQVLPGRKVVVGQQINLTAKVKNEGDLPLYVKVRFNIQRAEVPRNIEIYSGQTYGGGGAGEPDPFIYVYAVDYIPDTGTGDWSNPGALIGPPDGVYSETTVDWADSDLYTFEQIDLAGRVIKNMDLQCYTSQPGIGTDNDFDNYIYVLCTDGNWRIAWCDSAGGSVNWAWTGGRYYQGSANDMPEYYRAGRDAHTQTGFNSMQYFVENYPAESGEVMRIDSVRWKVYFASITPVDPPVFVIQPGKQLDLDNVIWPTTEDHIGSYTLTATIEYSNRLFTWNSMGSLQDTKFFWIVP
jgi:hypothetical protein